VNNKVDRILEKMGVFGELVGYSIRKICTRQFTIIASIIVVVFFGTLIFFISMVNGAKKKQ
jgi:hypothetical protein